ncbi:MAG TPA: hypothetical protein VFX68_00635 [Sulfuricurvum sp.]|nr:hypothetical protein [Sulfuricurvum sp.]
MKILFSLVLLSRLLLNANELSFGNVPNHTQTSPKMQALQLHSSKNRESALNSLKNAPPYYRRHVDIYQEGEYYITRYQNSKYPIILPWILRDFKKAGFKDAYVVSSSDASSLASDKPKSLSLPKTASNSLNHQPIQAPLNQHDQTRLIADARKAYEQRDFTQATICYEIMIASGMKEHQILLNLAYLYGREGSFGLLEKKIEGKRGINEYLYAYGAGALEAGRSDLYHSFSPYLIYDKSGKLAMLCGYFFEQENDPKRAAAFYKMAYDASPSDPHILYAYARSVDISGDKEKALYLYTQITQLGSAFDPLRTASQSRIQTLRRIQ